MTAEDWTHILYFKPENFTEPDKMKFRTINALDMVRHEAGVPIYVSSSYRDGDPRAHGAGYAVDITDDLHHDGVKGRWVWLVVNAAIKFGFNRIGVYNAHVHLDMDPNLPPDVMWGGESE